MLHRIIDAPVARVIAQGLVLGDEIVMPGGRAHCEHLEPLRMVRELEHEIEQPPIGAARQERRVKVAVRIDRTEEIGTRPRHRLAVAGMRALDVGPVQIVGVLERVSERPRLQDQAQLVDLFCVAESRPTPPARPAAAAARPGPRRPAVGTPRAAASG